MASKKAKDFGEKRKKETEARWREWPMSPQSRTVAASEKFLTQVERAGDGPPHLCSIREVRLILACAAEVSFTVPSLLISQFWPLFISS